MALRTVLAVALLIVAVAAPPAAAQLLGGLGNIMISGTVPCSPDATTITATTPVFPNATVLLQCGDNMVASTVTNSNGVFSMLLGANPLTQLLSSLLGSCKLVVPTPLSACNPMMSSTGFLQSPLQLLSGNGFLGGILGGLRNVIPSLFKLVP
ncbi:phylloplanin-like [Curcuma longa]|uniref:phylloplanin-like n=1 Tax=Curcuma longa TaxID=136217 RepID=UPI003D9E2AB4